MLTFSALWLLVVYAPITHWVWGGGWLGEMGLLDFAGGTVVHITAGVAALVAAIVMGPRQGFPSQPMPPHNMTMTITGAGLLWVGWFGFNAGSALAANGDAGHAYLSVCRSTDVGGLRVEQVRAAECPRRRDRNGRRPWHHYSGLRICWPGWCVSDWYFCWVCLLQRDGVLEAKVENR